MPPAASFPSVNGFFIFPVVLDRNVPSLSYLFCFSSCLLLPHVLGFFPVLLIDSAPSVLQHPVPQFARFSSLPSVSSTSVWAPVWSVLLLSSALGPVSWLCLSRWLSLSLLGYRDHSFALQKVQLLAWEGTLSCRDTYTGLLPILREWKILTISPSLVSCVNSTHDVIKFPTDCYHQLCSWIPQFQETPQLSPVAGEKLTHGVIYTPANLSVIPTVYIFIFIEV